jgi:hypothetical protein
MSKPVELIVTNTLYDALDKMSVLPDQLRATITDALCSVDGADTIARAILAEIAHGASTSLVFKAMAAIGGPSTKAEIVQRITAIRDNQASHATQ